MFVKCTLRSFHIRFVDMIYALQEATKGTSVAEMANITAAEEKTVDQEPLVYENKQVCIVTLDLLLIILLVLLVLTISFLFLL